MYLLRVSLVFIFVFGHLLLNGHPMPNTIINLNVDDKVSMDIQIPMEEFTLSYGKKILGADLNAELSSYVRRHIHFLDVNGDTMYYVVKNIWTEVDSNTFNGQYKEINIQLNIQPNSGAGIRKFDMHYDLVIHEVVTHEAMVSVLSDFDAGKLNGEHRVGVIGYDHNEKRVFPLQIDLGPSQPFLGFKIMFLQGVHHISEGLDHLLFLLFLLISGPLVAVHRKWEMTANFKDTLIKNFKIISAFTVGHSITLVLGSLGYNGLTSQVVEIIIALSVFITVLHSIIPIFQGRELVIALIFGSVHGFAFSNILLDLGLNHSRLVQSLLAFNLGIEVMQLFIAGMIIPLLFLLSKTSLYSYFRYALGIFGMVVSLAWIWERVSSERNWVTEWIELQPYMMWYIVTYLIFLTIIGYVFRNRILNFNFLGIKKVW